MTPETSAAAPATVPRSVPPYFRIFILTGTVALVLMAGYIYRSHRQYQHLPRVVKRTQATSDNLPKANVLSDGSYLYLSETFQGRHVISKLPIEGRSPTSVQLPWVEGIGDSIAPDRSSILLSRMDNSQETIWNYPLGQGTSQRLKGMGRSATVSPDGQRIAYVRDSALWISNSHGENAREVTRVEGTVFSPGSLLTAREFGLALGTLCRILPPLLFGRFVLMEQDCARYLTDGMIRRESVVEAGHRTEVTTFSR